MRRVVGVAVVLGLSFSVSAGHASFFDKLKSTVETVTQGAIGSSTSSSAASSLSTDQIIAGKYFERVASADLMATVEPVIDNALKQVGAISAYDSLISKYKGLPLVPDIKADLQAHATHEKGRLAPPFRDYAGVFTRTLWSMSGRGAKFPLRSNTHILAITRYTKITRHWITSFRLLKT